jgi:subtilisin family serine protease
MKTLVRAWLVILIAGMSAHTPSLQTAHAAAARAQARPNADALAPAVRAALSTLPAGDKLGVIVRMREIADTKPLPDTAGMDKAQARATLVTSLQLQASAAQAGVMAWLQQPAVAPQIDGLRAYWIINGFAVRATAGVINDLAARPDVASVRLDGWVEATQNLPPADPQDLQTLPAPIQQRMQTDPPQPPAFPFMREPLMGPDAAEAPQASATAWGISLIRADQVWDSLSVTGEGVVVANIDSGVDWQHPALQARYRGFAGGPVADHFHNWYDATDEGAIYPSDPFGHGTHVMGTMVGQNGVGVAPGARWMAVKGLNSDGAGQYSWLHSAFQFVLAPGGDPRYAPDILNNSWGSANGFDDEFKEDLAALRAAGIFAVFSNGNRGPGAGTVSTPAGLPSAVAVGASDADDDIAYFSSRGPSPLTQETKPTLVAPGVGITSTFPGGGYKALNGTSMAAPHVAGAAALLLSANPSLDITQTLFVLTSTAQAVTTGTLPNSITGWGRIDAYSATLSVMTSGVVSGVVSSNGQPIAGASVVAEDAPSGLRAQAVTDSNGRYVLRMAAGAYMISAGAFGHLTRTVGPRLVITGNLLQQDIALEALPSGVVRGAVRDSTTGAFITATVLAKDTPRASMSNLDCPACRYELRLPAGAYRIEARVAGYTVQTQQVVVADGGVVEADFALAPAQRIAFVDSGAAFYASAADAFQEAFDALQLGYDEFRIKAIPGDTPTLTRLLTYDAVVWSAPYDAPSFVGASGVLSGYLAAGKPLLLTGQSIALYEGGGTLNYTPYFLNQINAVYIAKNREAAVVKGTAGTPLAGMTLAFTNTTSRFAPDVVEVLRPNSAQLIGEYGNAVVGYRGAGVWSDSCVKHRSAYFAFGLESLGLADRVDVMRRTLQAFATPRPALGVSLASANAAFTSAAIGQPGQTVTHSILLRNTGDGGITQTFDLQLRNNRWPMTLSQSSVTLGPCATARITATVGIPASAGLNETDSFEVVAAVNAAPDTRAVLALDSKTPAGILLVDDDRFINREIDYMQALLAQGNSFDRWSTQWGFSITNSPPLSFLQHYPLVIWQNGYDWYDPIRPEEQTTLMRYLDGGGRLFFTSQAALAFTGLSPFAQGYLGVGNIDFDDVTSNVVGASGTPLGDGPFGSTLLPFPYNWNLSSAVQPTPGTQVFVRGESGQPFGLMREEPTYEARSRPAWRTVFAPFAFEAMAPPDQHDVMNRIVGWLSPLGHSSVHADVDTVAPGQPVNIAVTLRADEVAGRGPQPAGVTMTLPAGFTLLSSSMPDLQWAGPVRGGEVLTWTFTLLAAGSVDPGTPLTVSAHFALPGLGMRFTQSKVIRVNAPALTLDIHETRPARWEGEMALRVTVTNAGLSDARNAIITAVVPPSITLNAGPLAASLPGHVMTATGAIFWQGDIPRGQTLTLDIQGRMPALTPRMTRIRLQATALADDPHGRLTQASVTLAPFTARLFHPYMPVDAR